MANELKHAIARPVPACAIDAAYHLKKGTARAAFDGGGLVGVARIGRGGKRQVWCFEDDARSWFEAGMPLTKSQVTP